MKRIALLTAAMLIASPVFAQNVATVNGVAITQESMDQFVSLLKGQGATDSPELRKQVKEEMINRQIMVQAAEKAGIAKDSAVGVELELARQGILVRALMADYLKKNPVSEADLKAEYEKLKKAEEGSMEYRVRHILVDDEKTANDLLEKLKKKTAKFADLAKKTSKDPGSAEKGGELDWAPATNYVEPFAVAVKSASKGTLIDKPVRTQFGFHIIEVEDTRPIQVPTFEKVKPQMEEMLRQQTLAKYQQELRTKAEVKDAQ